YAQSYRDLANAHKEYSQFQDAWKYYMNYLIRGGSLEGEGIEKTVYNEMEYLYYNRPNQTKIKQKFTPQHKNKIEFRDDVRFVVEWNTSEAEFDLEFVGPDKRAYVFEHTLIGNQDLITEEKQFGFSSKEFIIDDVGNGEWLVNLTYKGNKKSAPTYLKFTTYYNWGKPEQRQETKVYKLQRKNLKYNLLKINEQSLVASN
ncbi:MAG: YfaP family protein, partial [bacterium]